jgi:serine/threonine-protein kinase RsbW
MHAEMVLPSELARMVDARTWATSHARAAGYDDEAVNAVGLALTETLSNVIRHRYRGEANHEIRVELDADPQRIVLSVRDWGDFDPAAYTPADLDQPRDGGYGIYLIRALMDEVHCVQTSGGDAELSLVRYHDRPPAGPVSPARPAGPDGSDGWGGLAA